MYFSWLSPKMKLPSLATPEGLAWLDHCLLDRSFLSGFSPTKADLTVLRQLGQKTGLEQYTNICRWVYNLKSYSSEEQGQFPPGEPVEIDLVSDAVGEIEVRLGLVLLSVAQLPYLLTPCMAPLSTPKAHLLQGSEEF